MARPTTELRTTWFFRERQTTDYGLPTTRPGHPSCQSRLRATTAVLVCRGLCQWNLNFNLKLVLLLLVTVTSTVRRQWHWNLKAGTASSAPLTLVAANYQCQWERLVNSSYTPTGIADESDNFKLNWVAPLRVEGHNGAIMMAFARAAPVVPPEG